jgi:hypothetical protein
VCHRLVLLQPLVRCTLSGLPGRKQDYDQDYDHGPEASRSPNFDLINERAVDPFASMVST